MYDRIVFTNQVHTVVFISKGTKVCNCWAIARALWLISARAYPGFYSKRLGVLLSLDGMLVHRRLPPQLWLVPIYSWVERSNQSSPGLQTNVPVTGIEPMTLGL